MEEIRIHPKDAANAKRLKKLTKTERVPARTQRARREEDRLPIPSAFCKGFFPAAGRLFLACFEPLRSFHHDLHPLEELV
jgi:hypothetical protein